jgi:putative membrane protein
MRILLIPLLIIVGSLSLATKRQDPSGSNTTRTDATDTRGSKEGTRADGFLAGCLLIDGGNEIAFAEIAQQKAQDPEVKRFAQEMIDEHRQMGQKLQPFASVAGFTGAGNAGSATPPGKTGNDRSMGSAGDVDQVMLVQELGQQCRESGRAALSEQSGAEFDRCYMGMMVGAHMKAKDMLTVFERHASPSLKSVLADAQTTVTKHLESAKSIARKLDGKTTGAKSGSPGGDR